MKEQIKQQIKALSQPKLEPIKFLGLDCFIRRWNAGDRVRWSIALETATEKTKVTTDDGKEYFVDYWFQIKAIAKSLADENGELLFEDFNEVGEIDLEDLGPVFDAVMKVQKIGDDSEAVEVAKKN